MITQERGLADAALAISKIKAWPIQWLHSDAPLCSEAAKLKAAHKISFADAFVAATAKRFGATLLRKDLEFRAPAGVMKQQILPPKSSPPGS